MPEIAESVVSKEDEDDAEFGIEMHYVPKTVSQSQRIEQFDKTQSTPSPEKVVGPKPEKVNHPQKLDLIMTVETE